MGQPLAKGGHERTQLGNAGHSLGDLLQRPEAVQHPELRQRHADFGLVVIVFVVSIVGVQADALGVLSREAVFGLRQRGVRLNGEHLVDVQDL